MKNTHVRPTEQPDLEPFRQDPYQAGAAYVCGILPAEVPPGLRIRYREAFRATFRAHGAIFLRNTLDYGDILESVLDEHVSGEQIRAEANNRYSANAE